MIVYFTPHSPSDYKVVSAFSIDPTSKLSLLLRRHLLTNCWINKYVDKVSL